MPEGFIVRGSGSNAKHYFGENTRKSVDLVQIPVWKYIRKTCPGIGETCVLYPPAVLTGHAQIRRKDQ